jgi:hypothetical protein
MRSSIRWALVAVAILAVVFATTVGAVWHTHKDISEASCPICHLNHQPIDNALSVEPELPEFAPVGNQPQAREPALVESAVIPRVPARAPPAT